MRKVGLWRGERGIVYKRVSGRQRDLSVLKLGSLPGPAGRRNPGASVHIRSEIYLHKVSCKLA